VTRLVLVFAPLVSPSRCLSLSLTSPHQLMWPLLLLPTNTIRMEARPGPAAGLVTCSASPYRCSGGGNALYISLHLSHSPTTAVHLADRDQRRDGRKLGYFLSAEDAASSYKQGTGGLIGLRVRAVAFTLVGGRIEGIFSLLPFMQASVCALRLLAGLDKAAARP